MQGCSFLPFQWMTIKAPRSCSVKRALCSNLYLPLLRPVAESFTGNSTPIISDSQTIVLLIFYLKRINEISAQHVHVAKVLVPSSSLFHFRFTFRQSHMSDSLLSKPIWDLYSLPGNTTSLSSHFSCYPNAWHPVVDILSDSPIFLQLVNCPLTTLLYIVVYFWVQLYVSVTWTMTAWWWMWST